MREERQEINNITFSPPLALVWAVLASDAPFQRPSDPALRHPVYPLRLHGSEYAAETAGERAGGRTRGQIRAGR